MVARALTFRPGRWTGAVLVALALAVLLFQQSLRRDRWMRGAPGSADELVFTLDADAAIRGWVSESHPTLLVGCRRAEPLEFVVQTRMAAEVEPGDQRSVRYWFDDDAPATTSWTQARNRQSLAAPGADARALAERLSRAGRFTFAYVPFNADPAVVTFTTHGFDAHWRELQERCAGG